MSSCGYLSSSLAQGGRVYQSTALPARPMQKAALASQFRKASGVAATARMTRVIKVNGMNTVTTSPLEDRLKALRWYVSDVRSFLLAQTD
mmetsp:Transcript_144752/g.277853  ORF Transcript_144752/g.277853 Transcript_144752/m.277853 type:complete len:90 (-) Transcript_144752:1518-1787(-)